MGSQATVPWSKRTIHAAFFSTQISALQYPSGVYSKTGSIERSLFSCFDSNKDSNSGMVGSRQSWKFPLKLEEYQQYGKIRAIFGGVG